MLFRSQILLLSNGSTTRVLYFSRKIGFPRFQVVFMVPHMSQGILIPSFKPCIISLLSQLLKRPKNRLCKGKSPLCPKYSQTSRFFVNIIILKYNSSFYQGLSMIHQGLLKIHQDSKVAKLGFCRKSQLNFDQA